MCIRDRHTEVWNAYAVMKQALPVPDHPDIKEQRSIAQQMLNHKKAIEKALHENVQGFWAKENLMEYYAREMNAYYELAEKLCQLLLKNNIDKWIASRDVYKRQVVCSPVPCAVP